MDAGSVSSVVISLVVVVSLIVIVAAAILVVLVIVLRSESQDLCLWCTLLSMNSALNKKYICKTMHVNFL